MKFVVHAAHALSIAHALQIAQVLVVLLLPSAPVAFDAPAPELPSRPKIVHAGFKPAVFYI